MQKLLRHRQVIAQHTIIHAVKVGDGQPHAWVFGQDIAML